MMNREYELTRKDWQRRLIPLVLMLTGAAVLAAADLGVISLDRAGSLWPAAILLIGLAEIISDF